MAAHEWRIRVVKLTKEQRVFVAILGLALSALTVDRFLLGGSFSGPAGANAGEAPASPADGQPGLVVKPTERAKPDAADDHGIADRLNSLRDQAAEPEAMADVLSVPSSWFEAQTTGQATGQTGQSARQAEEKSAQSKYRLSGVYINPVNPATNFAIINKRHVHVGEEIDGMKLVEIRSRQAVFQGGSEKLVLEMGVAAKEGKPEQASAAPAPEAEAQAPRR